MYEVGLSAIFHATHSLRGDFGPAQLLHAHDYRIDVTARGETLNEQGVLLDVVQLESAMRAEIDHLDGACLDALPELAGINTTVEALSAYLHGRISSALSSHTHLTLEVRLWENPNVWGGYTAPIG